MFENYLFSLSAFLFHCFSRSVLNLPIWQLHVNSLQTTCEIIKALEPRQWRHSVVFVVNFEHISYFVVVFLLLTLNRQVSAGWWVTCHCGSRTSNAIVPSCLRGYLVGPTFFPWVFRGSKIFSCRFFVGPKFFLVYISWLKDFQLMTAWERCDRKHKYINASQTAYSIPNRFQ